MGKALISKKFGKKNSGQKIFFFAFIFVLIVSQPNNSQIFQSSEDLNQKSEIIENGDHINLNINNQTKSPFSMPKITTPSAATENIVQLNVSQFDVREDIESITPKSELSIDNENLTIQIPSDWNLLSHELNISALYKPWQMLLDQNVTLSDVTVPRSPWYFASSNHPDLINWGLYGDYQNQMLNIIGTSAGGIGTTIPDSALADWYQWLQKPDPNLTIYEREKLSSGQVQYPLYNEFTSEPDWGNTQVNNESGNAWQKNLDNPFGGKSGTTTKDLFYDDVDDQLGAYIHAGSSNFTLGNPSIGYQVNFSDPTAPDFIPKQFILSFAWSIVDSDYEASDNLSVIVKVDGQYIDGRFDIDGNFYPNATQWSVENSINNSEYLEHDMIVRSYDITNLIDTTKVNHTVEFGIWFEGINETNDEVEVYFGGIAVAAVEEDQYKIGDFDFDLSIDFPAIKDVRYWYLFSYFSDGIDDIFVPIGLLTDIFGLTTQGTTRIHLNLTTRLKYFLDSDTSLMALGIINVGGSRPAPSSDFYVSFDNLSLSPFYMTQNFSKAGFQIYNGTDWEEINSNLLNPINPIINQNLTLQFRTTNSSYKNSILAFESSLRITRTRINDSYASYYIDDVQADMIPIINWNVTFNNTNTFEQYANNDYYNFDPVEYNFTIIDLPAWDNLGNASEDWNWISGKDPLGNIPDYSSAVRRNGTNNSGLLQNATVQDATKQMGDGNNSWFINGTWTLQFTSKNYIESVGIRHISGSSSQFYSGNSTIITVNRTGPGGLIGTYNITIKNATGDMISGFPQFIQSSSNVSDPWIVQDFGVGNYQIIGFWNDSGASSGQITRVGIKISTFGLWRKSQASLLLVPDPLNSGDKGSFYLNFSEIDGTPISGAEDYIQLHVNSTDSIWGLDWPPYQSLVESVVENSSLNAEGNYTLTFRTRSVPTGNYLVYIRIRMPFYEFQRLDNAWINISGYEIDFEFLSGGFNISRYFGYVFSNNLPIVNDTSHSVFEIKITNHTNANPLENGIVSGTFNGSENVFYGEEIYRETQNEADKGKYRIYIDGTGLNTTNLPEFNNYTLTLTVSVDGYNSTYMKLSTRVLPVITQLTADELTPTYEGGEFQVYVSYQNFNDPGSPLPLNNASIGWFLKDYGTSTVITSGTLDFVLSGVYKASILLNTESYYISPGHYSLEINATQRNCANATWLQTDIEVLSKYNTTLQIAVNDLIQIGSDLNIRVNLTYENGTVFQNTEVSIQINYTGEEPFNVVSVTNNEGIASYTQTVPTQYAEKNVSIKAVYAGTSEIRSSSAVILNKYVKGKNAVNLTIQSSSTIQVGYTVTLTGQLTIEGFEQYTDIFVTIAAWYDRDSQNLFFLQQVYPNTDGSYQFITPEIEDGHQDITFFVDYAGTETEEYASDQIGPLTVLGKWETNFSISNVSSNIRIGQTISFDIQASFLNVSSTETLYGASFFIYFDYPGQHLITEYYLDEFNHTTVEFIIPQDCGSYLNITINYAGTSKIAPFSISTQYSVLPKWNITLSMQNIDGFTRIGQIIQFNITVSYDNSSEFTMDLLQGNKFFVIYQYLGSNPIFTENIFSTSIYYEISYEIPQDCGNLLNMTLLFQEDDKILLFNYTYTIPIAPKWAVTLNLQDISSILRIGQTISMNISVENNETGFNMNMLQGNKFFVIYQYLGSNQIFTDYIFSTSQVYEIEYLISQDCGSFLNITLLFQGDAYFQEYNHTFTLNILPKWSPHLQIDDLPNNLRQGQRFEINIVGNFTEGNSTAQISEVSISISITFGNIISTFNFTFDKSGLISFNYSIPVADAQNLEISLNTIETQTIGVFQAFISTEILPQMDTRIVILGTTFQQDYIGEFSIKAKLLDQDENPVIGQRLWFLLKDSSNSMITNKSAITNEEGIAVTAFQIDSVGEYSIEPVFTGKSIFKAASIASNTAEIYSVRVINVWIQLMDNIMQISIALGAMIALSAVYYRGYYIPKKKKQIAALMEMHQRFVDIENLQYLMIIHKNTGLSIFSQAFTEIPIDENLISGFLSAISSFGKEIGDKVSHSSEIGFENAAPASIPAKPVGLEELAYKQFKIVVIEGEYIRTAVLLLKSASVSLKSKIKNFNQAFEAENQELLTNWSGKQLDPEPIVRIIEIYLFADLLYEHRLAQSKVPQFVRSLNRKSIKNLIIQEAENKFNNSFKVREMIIALTAYGKKDVDTFNAINELREEGIVFAINSRTRQLIEQFKPLIQPLTKEQRQTLIAIGKGIRDNAKIEKETKIPLIIPVLTALQRMELVTENNDLTEQGEIITTLLSLIPDI
ncbi:MAG: hypothetical protein DRO88_09000 [Promethearchaeia archaeon]|nr:MAG: hypothetical protein DRO88_09000 [Candidatus Lokiarchaeia archaeon]